MERTKLTNDRVKKAIKVKWKEDHTNTVGFYSRTGKLLFQVCADDLYDADGNRFDLSGIEQ